MINYQIDYRMPVERFEDLESPEVGERAVSAVNWVDAGVEAYKDDPVDGWVRLVIQENRIYIRQNGSWILFAEERNESEIILEDILRLSQEIASFSNGHLQGCASYVEHPCNCPYGLSKSLIAKIESLTSQTKDGLGKTK